MSTFDGESPMVEVYQDGYDRGHSEGYDDGYSDALCDVEAAIRKLQERQQ